MLIDSISVKKIDLASSQNCTANIWFTGNVDDKKTIRKGDSLCDNWPNFSNEVVDFFNSK